MNWEASSRQHHTVHPLSLTFRPPELWKINLYCWNRQSTVFLLQWPEQTVIVIKTDTRVLKADSGTQLSRSPSRTATPFRPQHGLEGRGSDVSGMSSVRGAAAVWQAFSTSIHIFFWCVIRSDRFSWAFWGIFVSCSSFPNPRMPLWIWRERFLFPSSALAQLCTLMCRLRAGPERWEPPVHRGIASPVWWWLVLHCFPFAACPRLETQWLQASKYGGPPLSLSVLSWVHHLVPRKSQANHLTFPCFCFFIYNMIIKTQFVDAVVWLKWVKRSKLLETVPDLE